MKNYKTTANMETLNKAWLKKSQRNVHSSTCRVQEVYEIFYKKINSVMLKKKKKRKERQKKKLTTVEERRGESGHIVRGVIMQNCKCQGDEAE